MINIDLAFESVPAGNIDISTKKLQLGGGGLLYNDGTGRTRIDTPNGYLTLGPSNGSFCHFYTGSPAFYFNKNVEAVQGFEVYNTNTYLRGTGSRVGVGTADINGSSQQSTTGLEVYQPTSTSDSMMSFHIDGNYGLHFGLCKDRRRLVTGGWSDGNVKRDVLTRQHFYYSGLNNTRILDFKTTGNQAYIQLWAVQNGARFTLNTASYQVGDKIEIVNNNPIGTLNIRNDGGRIYMPDGTSVLANVDATLSVAGTIRLYKISQDWMLSRG